MPATASNIKVNRTELLIPTVNISWEPKKWEKKEFLKENWKRKAQESVSSIRARVGEACRGRRTWMPKSKIHFPCHEFSMASFVETSLQMCLVKNYVDDTHIYYFLLCIPICCCIYAWKMKQWASTKWKRLHSIKVILLHVMMLFIFLKRHSALRSAITLLSSLWFSFLCTRFIKKKKKNYLAYVKFNFQAYKFLLSKIIIYATQQVSNIKANNL
jgi:hypothetical protein